MKDYLKQIASGQENNLVKRCKVREYLQARILQTLQGVGSFLSWAFLGGTALRFLYSMPRFSEDLDFSLADPSHDGGFAAAVDKIKRIFEAEGYGPQLKARETKAVCSAFMKFPGLYHEIGLSPHRMETLSIKLELDTNPPKGAGTATTIVRRHVTLNLLHHDKPSLLAGKLHALLQRSYTKGRDLYDLVWYLADRSWPEPNLTLLNNALEQTGWTGPMMTPENWREELGKRLTEIDWGRIEADLLPFLERQDELALITRENCLGLVLGM